MVRSSRIVLPDAVAPASIHNENGRIVRFGGCDDARGAIDFGDLVVLPGIVDTHVRVNEPGRAEWQGLDTATRAAAAGGVTAIVDVPLNSDMVAMLERRLANDPDDELRIAAGEQQRITRLRLDKLLS